MFYSSTKVKVCTPNGQTNFFDIVPGVQQGDTLTPYLFKICLDYVFRTSFDLIKENGITLKKRQEVDDTLHKLLQTLALFTNTPIQAESLLHCLSWHQNALASTRKNIKQNTSVSIKRDLNPL